MKCKPYVLQSTVLATQSLDEAYLWNYKIFNIHSFLILMNLKARLQDLITNLTLGQEG
jgi:hypothetical protein